MKISNAFNLLAVAALFILGACGNETENTEAVKKDSVAVSAKTPAALQLLNEKLEKDPSDAPTYNERAKYFIETRDLKAALSDITKAMNIDSSKSDYFVTISDVYFLTNQTGNSKLALEKAITLDPKNTTAILKLAELYLYVGKNDKSIEYINMALKIDQYIAKAYFMKGMNYKDLKDTARAMSSMQTAVEQEKNYYQAYIQLGILAAGKYDPLAIQYYKNAIRIQPKSTEAWYDLGKYYQDAGDAANAIATYKTLLTFEKNKNAAYNIGVVYLVNLKKYDLAIDYFSQAINTDPNYFEAYYGRGVSYQYKSDKKTAAADFQSALMINPKYEPAQTALQEMGVK
ncbi:MAG: tetratricopeptide repeat protein [Bacteroidota bacterium]|nr:tetratricopeptide repeat protein [Bacteroidota bacterium]